MCFSENERFQGSEVRLRDPDARRDFVKGRLGKESECFHCSERYVDGVCLFVNEC